MSDTADLTVRVLDDRDIVVAGAEFEVTYRREGHLGMLVATDALRERLTASKARFLAEAWKAAYKDRLHAAAEGQGMQLGRLKWRGSFMELHCAGHMTSVRAAGRKPLKRFGVDKAPK